MRGVTTVIMAGGQGSRLYPLTKDRAKRSALNHLVDTFFNGSAEQAMAALLDDSSAGLSAGRAWRESGTTTTSARGIRAAHSRLLSTDV